MITTGEMKGLSPVAVWAIAFILFIASTPPGLAESLPTWTPAATIDSTLLFDGQVRAYRTHVPGFLGREPERPLVVVLHGTGGNGPGIEALTGFDLAADTLGLIVAYPTGTAISGQCCDWNDHRPPHEGPDDVGFLDAMLEAIASRHRLAVGRVYVTGLSNGGLMAIRLACERTATYAAFAPVAATLTTAQVARGCDPTPKPVLLIDGDADPIEPFLGGPMPTPGDGVGLGAKKTRNYFARQYGCEPVWTAVSSNPNPYDLTTLTEFTAAPCNGRPVAVKLIRIRGGGHTWPNERPPHALWALLAGPTTRDFDGALTISNWFLEQ